MKLLLLVLLLLPLNWSQQQEPSNKKEHTPSNFPISRAAIRFQDSETAESETNSTSDQSKDRPDVPPWWDVTWATWGLVIIGGIASWIAICTLRDIREQTRNARTAAIAARDGANAALLNAQAVINAERSWVFVHWEKEHAQLAHNLYMENHGRTPAEIRDVFQADDYTPLHDLEKRELSDIPKYPDQKLVSVRVLAPGEKWYPVEWFTPVNQITPDFPALESNRERLWFWGRVRYRDVLLHPNSEAHETRFCFFWSPSRDEFLIGGPSEYTKHT